MEFNTEEREKMGLVNCSKVYVSQSKYGYGVFAKDNYKKGEIVKVLVERATVTTLIGNSIN